MTNIVLISGSPSANSRSGRILHYIGEQLEAAGFSRTHFNVTDIPAADLVEGNFQSEALQPIKEVIARASGIVIGSPVYKASYSGILKAFIDLLPQDALEGKVVFPVMTGGSPAHLLAIDYALKPLIHTVKGEPIQGLYLQDSQIDRSSNPPIQDLEMQERLHKQIEIFSQKLRKRLYERV